MASELHWCSNHDALTQALTADDLRRGFDFPPAQKLDADPPPRRATSRSPSGCRPASAPSPRAGVAVSLPGRKDSSVDRPETRYAKTADGVHIAYEVLGEGPGDLVFVPGFVFNVELSWEWPQLARFARRLAASLASSCSTDAGQGSRITSFRPNDNSRSKRGWRTSVRSWTRPDRRCDVWASRGVRPLCDVRRHLPGPTSPR